MLALLVKHFTRVEEPSVQLLLISKFNIQLGGMVVCCCFHCCCLHCCYQEVCCEKCEKHKLCFKSNYIWKFFNYVNWSCHPFWLQLLLYDSAMAATATCSRHSQVTSNIEQWAFHTMHSKVLLLNVKFVFLFFCRSDSGYSKYKMSSVKLCL